LKNMMKSVMKSYFYLAVCAIAYLILIHFHVRPYYPAERVGFFSLWVSYFLTLSIGDFVCKRVDKYFIKRKAVKVAKAMGYKKSDIEKIEVTREGDEDIVDIILKDKEGEKK
jgi:hypothetical protein